MKKNEIEHNLIKKIDKGFGDTISRAIKTVTRGKIEECNGFLFFPACGSLTQVLA